MLIGAGEGVTQKAGPGVIGKGVGRHAAFGKAQGSRGLGLHQRLACLGLRCGQQLLLQLGHIIATLGLGIDVAFYEQLGIGIFHRNQADAQIFGQHALGGQLFAGFERAGKNIVFDAFIKMGVHALTLKIGKAIGKHGVNLQLVIYFC